MYALYYFVKFYLFYFWLCWAIVAAHGLSQVALSRGYSLVAVSGFSLWWRLLSRSTGFSRCSGLSSCSQQAPEHQLSSCGAQAQLPCDVRFHFITNKTSELGRSVFITVVSVLSRGFAGATVERNPPDNAGDPRDIGQIPGSGTVPWRRKWQPTPVFLLGKFHGQRNLAGYSPWSHKESDRTELLSMHACFFIKDLLFLLVLKYHRQPVQQVLFSS